ncbi:MAG: hypothetical protein AAGL29_12125 [Bacteroidota bacterium]
MKLSIFGGVQTKVVNRKLTFWRHWKILFNEAFFVVISLLFGFQHSCWVFRGFFDCGDLIYVKHSVGLEPVGFSSSGDNCWLFIHQIWRRSEKIEATQKTKHTEKADVPVVFFGNQPIFFGTA